MYPLVKLSYLCHICSTPTKLAVVTLCVWAIHTPEMAATIIETPKEAVSEPWSRFWRLRCHGHRGPLWQFRLFGHGGLLLSRGGLKLHLIQSGSLLPCLLHFGGLQCWFGGLRLGLQPHTDSLICRLCPGLQLCPDRQILQLLPDFQLRQFLHGHLLHSIQTLFHSMGLDHYTYACSASAPPRSWSFCGVFSVLLTLVNLFILFCFLAGGYFTCSLCLVWTFLFKCFLCSVCSQFVVHSLVPLDWSPQRSCYLVKVVSPLCVYALLFHLSFVSYCFL